MRASTNSSRISTQRNDLKDRPQVLHLIKGLGLGGAERLIAEGAKCWDRQRFQYSVGYFVPWKDQLVDQLSRSGIEVTLFGNGRGIGIRSALRVRSHLRSAGIDLVHIHSPGIASVVRPVVSIPVVYTEHNVVDSYHPLTRRANEWTYGLNTVVVAVSDAVADSVAHAAGGRPRVIVNGVSCAVTNEETAAVRADLGLDGTPLVVHVGNIRPGKGHDNLVATARIALASQPDLTFVSIGVEKYPGMLVRLRDASADLGDHVRFLGMRSDALAFTASGDVFVNPSEVEGLPVAILEAMDLGTPVVATAAGGVPSIVRDGETGRLVPVNDPEALAAATLETLSDRQSARRMAEAARASVRSQYSLEAMVGAYESVYEEALHG